MDSPTQTSQKAEARDYLAAERTFLAWVRTGLALMGFGFVVARFGLFLKQVGLFDQASSEPSYLTVYRCGSALPSLGRASSCTSLLLGAMFGWFANWTKANLNVLVL